MTRSAIWGHIPFRRGVSEIDIRGGANWEAYELMSVSQYRGVIPRSEVTDKEARAEDLSKYKRCFPGDIVLNRMSAYNGALGLARQEGLVSPDYAVLRSSELFDSRYLTYFMRSTWFVGQMTKRLKGIGDPGGTSVRTPRVNIEDLGDIDIPLPAIDEQRRIADFLDDQVGRINRIRACRQRQLQSIHDRFQMEIDFHFSSSANKKNEAFVAARHVVKVLPGYAFSSENYVNDESQIKLLRGINLGIRQLNWLDVVYWRRDQAKGLQEYLLRPGDLVLGMDRPWISGGMRIAIVQESDIPSLLLQRVAKLIPSPDMKTEYVYWAYQSSDFRQLIESDLSGISVPHLSAEQILGYRIPKRPIHDQAVVARHLADSLEQIKGIMSDIRTGIQLLEERKQALITGAVTGRLNVSTVTSIEVAL